MMIQWFEQLSSASRTRQLIAAGLAIVSLSIIASAGIQAWQYDCPESAHVTISLQLCPSLVEHIVVLLIALGFWGSGVVTWLGSQRLIGLGFLLLIADILATGMMGGSSAASDGGERLFYLLLAWFLPILFQFHLALLSRQPRRSSQIILWLLCGLAVASSLLLLLYTTEQLQQHEIAGLLRASLRLGLVGAWALSWFLLFCEYREYPSAVLQRRIRVVTFGTLMAFVPFVLLSLLPDTLRLPVRVPYIYTLPWLLISPLAYIYSIFRRQLVKAEASLNRAAVYYLLSTFLLSVYMAAAASLAYVAPQSNQGPLLHALLGVVLLLLFMPLRRGLQWLVSWVLYGGEISYREVVAQMAESFATTLDRVALHTLLIRQLPSVMRLSSCALFLKNGQDELAVWATVGLATNEGHGIPSLPLDGPLASFLLATAEPVSDARLRKAVAREPLKQQDQAIMAFTHWSVWLPLVYAGTFQGLMLIARLEDDYFSSEDERILKTVAHQSAIAIQNLYLMEETRAGREELAQAHRKLLEVREHEWARLAHELHDGAVQQLLNISFQLASADQNASITQLGIIQERNRDARQQVLAVTSQLRGLIRELRPPGLSEFGLPATLESYIARLRREANGDFPDMELDFNMHADLLPEPIAICLFRVAQEGLRNILKHAQAHAVWIRLRMQDKQVELHIEDDGCGFRGPARLGELATRGHYGLVGLDERVSWLRGRFSVESWPGRGTTIDVVIPLGEAGEYEGKNTSVVGG